MLTKNYFSKTVLGDRNSKYIGAWEMLGLKNIGFKKLIFGPKKLGPEEFKVQKDIVSKKLESKNILGCKQDLVNIVCVKENEHSKTFLPNKTWAHNYFWPKNLVREIF